jgi:hypothetical protein
MDKRLCINIKGRMAKGPNMQKNMSWLEAYVGMTIKKCSMHYSFLCCDDLLILSN